ncbi:MAG TPA: PHB depolymerase family esterase [Phototrophicaceae bacterium]|nr:PHB depolymerase family esterase [Phototrophicaceae bacterium]
MSKLPETLIRETLIYTGLERSYLLYAPPNLKPASPLVMVLHGRGIAAEIMFQISGNSFTALADQAGFILVYPNAVDEIWNDGRLIGDKLSNADDVGFIRALIDHLSARYPLDVQRIYVTGLSNGGHMAYRLACELSDQIAAIAPVAAPMFKHMSEACTPENPVAALIIMGTRDPVAPYHGGEARRLWLRWLKRHGTTYLSARETARFWAQVNHCTGEPSVTLLPDHDPRDGTQIETTVYASGAAPVELYTVIGGGHTWPGSPLVLPRVIFSRTSREIDASQVIWNFFEPIRR